MGHGPLWQARTLVRDSARPRCVRGHPRVDSEDEIGHLADAALVALGDYGSQFRALLLFLAYVGCRPGSCAAYVARTSTRLAARSRSASHSTARAGKGAEEWQGRIVTVPPPALLAIVDVPPRLDSPYLFHTSTGRRLSKGTLSYYFRPVRQRWAGRETFELYELRHACATLLMERGLPPHVVANQLGHSDGGALVQRLYGHPSERGIRDQIRIAFGSWGAVEE